MRVAVPLAVAAALFCASPTLAQQTGPHELEAFKDVRLHALQHVTHLYFALGCKVFNGEGQINSLRQSYTRPVYAAMQEFGVIDRDIGEKISEAAQFGLKESAVAGCDYWHDNVDEASELRQDALRVIQNGYD